MASASSSNQTTMQNSSRVENFYKFTKHSYSTPISIHVATLLTNKDLGSSLRGIGDKVAIIPKMNTTYLDNLHSSGSYKYEPFKSLEEVLLKRVKNEWGCSMCIKRIYHLYKYVDSDFNSFICCHHCESSNKLHRKIHDEHISLVRQYKTMSGGNNWVPAIVDRSKMIKTYEGEIVSNDMLFTDTPTSGNDNYREFSHYAYTPSDEFKLPENKFKMLNKAFIKYTSLFYKLFEKVGVGDDIIDSLKTLYTCLDEATYGKEQKPAVVWLYEILTHANTNYGSNWRVITPADKFKCVVDAICASPIGEAEGDQAFIGFYHTISNFILDLLEKGDSMTAVIKMITNRNDPTKYRQKTAPPKESHIAAAEKLCEGLQNTIHTVRELEELGAICCRGSKLEEKSAESSLNSAFSSMRTATKTQNKYGGFAKRCGKGIGRDIRPTTLKELFELVESGDIYDLKISKGCCNNAYTAKTTLAPGDLSTGVGHLWLFLLGESNTQRWTMTTKWLDITHLYNIKSKTRNNFHFIVKNARNSLIRYPIKGNCTLPEFLAPKHRNSEKAFQKLMKLTDVSIPKHDIAFGKACSMTKDNGDLSGNPEFIINNTTTIVISKAF